MVLLYRLFTSEVTRKEYYYRWNEEPMQMHKVANLATLCKLCLLGGSDGAAAV